MHYEVRKADTGFEVVEIAPRVLATCADQAMAHAFMAFLCQRPDFQETVALVPEVAKPQDAPVAAAKDTPQSEPEPEPEPTPETISIDAAFDRLRAGEKLADVAPLCGLSFGQLRSKWAHLKQREKKEAAASADKPADPVTDLVPAASTEVVSGNHGVAAMLVQDAIQEMSGAAQCTLCQKEFTATPDNQDLCARCAHGA